MKKYVYIAEEVYNSFDYSTVKNRIVFENIDSIRFKNYKFNKESKEFLLRRHSVCLGREGYGGAFVVNIYRVRIF